MNGQQVVDKGFDLIEPGSGPMAFAQHDGHAAAEFRVFHILGLEVGVDRHLPGQHGQEPGVDRLFEDHRIMAGHQPLRR